MKNYRVAFRYNDKIDIPESEFDHQKILIESILNVLKTKKITFLKIDSSDPKYLYSQKENIYETVTYIYTYLDSEITSKFNTDEILTYLTNAIKTQKIHCIYTWTIHDKSTRCSKTVICLSVIDNICPFNPVE